MRHARANLRDPSSPAPRTMQCPLIGRNVDMSGGVRRVVVYYCVLCNVCTNCSPAVNMKCAANHHVVCLHIVCLTPRRTKMQALRREL